MRKAIVNFGKGLQSIIFPNVCVCCGIQVTDKERHICSFCLNSRFESAGEMDNEGSELVLPEGVVAQHALWKFDKGGKLQQLLHYLKYDHLTKIGEEMGEKLALELKKRSDIMRRVDASAVLVPVPLHYLKFRKRGFNQAFTIAKGIQRVMEIPICDIKSVVRTRNTRTQTGFSLQKRIENVQNAFTVRNSAEFKDRFVIIVDDVFTTGATTFELASVLDKAGAASAAIVTAAQA